METTTLSPIALQVALSGFHGSETFTRIGLRRSDVITEGVRYLAEKAGAFWLAEAIVSYQMEAKFRQEDACFQTWYLAVSKFEGRSAAVLWCTFYGDDIVAKQLIPFTDFPLGNIDECLDAPTDEFLLSLQKDKRAFKLFAAHNELRGVTVMLPSEY